MDDPAGIEVHQDSHVFVSFAKTEFVNALVDKILEVLTTVELSQFLFMDMFDQIPADMQIAGNVLDGGKL
jgi:hypothetical protein